MENIDLDQQQEMYTARKTEFYAKLNKSRDLRPLERYLEQMLIIAKFIGEVKSLLEDSSVHQVLKMIIQQDLKTLEGLLARSQQEYTNLVNFSPKAEA